LLIVLLSLLAIGAIVAVLLVVTGAASNTRSSSSGSAATNALSTTSRKAPAVKPASVTVAVLNGTGAAGLARRTSLRLGAEGYREGAVATASDQTLTNTIVAYLPGHRADALAVATSLKLRPSAVQPVDAGTQAVACPPPAACAADVVVTLGSNLPAS
jgi:hypothetical protein